MKGISILHFRMLQEDVLKLMIMIFFTMKFAWEALGSIRKLVKKGVLHITVARET